MSIDPASFRQTMAQWSTGVTVVTTLIEGENYGMTASSFNSLSLEPTLVSVHIGKHVRAHDAILQSGFFAINVLSADQMEIGKRFAGMMPEITDRFANLETTTAHTGAPVLGGVIAWLDCALHATHDGGDHTIFVGEVMASGVDTSKRPLLYGNRKWGQFESMPTETALTHIVMFKLKENTAENIATIRQALLGLKEQIPLIRKVEVGANVVPSDRAYDIALVMVFDSLEDMEAYQVHPAHVAVSTEVIKPRVTSAVAVDYYQKA